LGTFNNMTINHHLDDATLLSFAAGSLPESLSAVVAAHVGVCTRCAHEVRKMERIGASLLASLEAEPLTKPSPVHALLRGEADAPRAIKARDGASGDVPAALAPIIGNDLDAIAWRRLSIGVWHYKLPLSAGAEGDLRLLKVGPGRRMPEHGHGGSELTLMLRGSYRDEIGEFRAGDVADLDDDVEHQPIAHPETGCICLVASDKAARFKGLIPRLVQPLTGL
jgi:putative transcriptional regulator